MIHAHAAMATKKIATTGMPMITAILSSDDESDAMFGSGAIVSTAMVGSDSTVMPSTAEASAAVPNLEVSEVRIASQGFESFSFVVAALQVEGGFGPAFQNLFASVVPTIRLNSRVVNMTGAAASSGQKPTVFLESGEAVEFDAVVVTLPLDTFPMPLEADIGRPLGTFANTTSPR